MTADTIRVMVVDDQPLFCSGMQMLIDAEPDLAYVGAAHDGDSAVVRASELAPDVILMDLRMPHSDGVQATARITAAPDAPRVIMLTTFRQDTAIARAVEAGACGFITKDAEPASLAAAIRSVHAGNTVFAAGATTGMLHDRVVGSRQPDVAAIAALTARERDVFLHTARGLANAEIAGIAYISETTVKTHVHSILAKLGLRSRVQIVAFAYEHGLLG